MEFAADLPADQTLARLFPDDAIFHEILVSRNIRSVHDLICVPPWELRDWLLVTEDEAIGILEHVWEFCASSMSTAYDMVAVVRPQQAPTPLPSLNSAIGGGLSGAFVEVAGPPAAGKTQFCIDIAALAVGQGGEVFWIDTEGTFSPPRVLEVLEAMFRKNRPPCEVRSAALAALGRIRARPCTSLRELDAITADLEQRARNVGQLPAAVIVDSVAAVARIEGGVAEEQRTAVPRRQAALSALAGRFKALVSSPRSISGEAPPCVVVTNQVAGDMAGGSRVTLGNVWHHAVNWRLVLSHLAPGDPRGLGLKENGIDGNRYLHVEKSPCSAPLAIRFTIDGGGLVEEGMPFLHEQPAQWVR